MTSYTYTCRAEAPADVAILLASCDILTLSYAANLPFGVRITFTSRWEKAKVRKCIKAIPDGHVMLRSLVDLDTLPESGE